MMKKRSSDKKQGLRSGHAQHARKVKGHGAERRAAAGRASRRAASAGPQLPLEQNGPGQTPLADKDARGPLWVPEGVDLEVVPADVRQAIAEVVEPVYKRLVLGADDPLEKSLGVTLAHLLWLEVLQQFDLKREYTHVSAVLGIPGDHQDVIDQHLRIIGAKVKVGYLLARLRSLRRHGPGLWPDGGAPDSEGRLSTTGGVQSHTPNEADVGPEGGHRPPIEGPILEKQRLVDQNQAAIEPGQDRSPPMEGPILEKQRLVDQNQAPIEPGHNRSPPIEGPIAEKPVVVGQNEAAGTDLRRDPNSAR